MTFQEFPDNPNIINKVIDKSETISRTCNFGKFKEKLETAIPNKMQEPNGGCILSINSRSKICRWKIADGYLMNRLNTRKIRLGFNVFRTWLAEKAKFQNTLGAFKK